MLNEPHLGEMHERVNGKLKQKILKLSSRDYSEAQFRESPDDSRVSALDTEKRSL